MGSKLVRMVQRDKSILAVPQRNQLKEKLTVLFPHLEDHHDECNENEPKEIKTEVEDDIKEEPEYNIEGYLEPSVSMKEEDPLNYLAEASSVNQTLGTVNEYDDSGPQIDVSTITSNTPLLALSTVKPETQVMGGSVTPWPPNMMVKIHPSLFIRTTCSKILLPPGLYSYQRNNGLKSIMSVKADTGTFDAIENHYHMCKTTKQDAKKSKGQKVDNIRWNTKVKKTYTSAHRKTPLQIYSQDCRKSLASEGVPREKWDDFVINSWANLSPEAKKKYNKRASLPVSPQNSTVNKKKTTNIPLPALKKFAVKIAPELKKKRPYLAKIENRGQLNKIILEKWMELTEVERTQYKQLAGVLKDQK